MNVKDFFERQTRIQMGTTLLRYKKLNKHVIGDSILFSGSSLCEQFPVNEMLQNRKLDYVVYNRGLSGATIDELICNVDILIYDLAPAKIFINIGSNDIGGFVYNEDDLYSKYINLLQQIKSKLPQTKVYVLSYYPVNPSKESYLDDDAKLFMFKNRTNENIKLINRRLDEYCKDRDIEYINVYDILLDEDGNLKDEYTVEGIHLFPNAYEKVLDIIAEHF